jgi:hypothetical protein
MSRLQDINFNKCTEIYNSSTSEEIPHRYIKHEDSLSSLQEAVTGTYAEPDESNTHPHDLLWNFLTLRKFLSYIKLFPYTPVPNFLCSPQGIYRVM